MESASGRVKMLNLEPEGLKKGNSRIRRFESRILVLEGLSIKKMWGHKNVIGMS